MHLSEYIQTFKKNGPFIGGIKVAILSSFTVTGLKEVLTVESKNQALPVEVYVCDYNQYSGDIYNSESALYKFKPSIVFLLLDVRSLLGDFAWYLKTDEERRDWSEITLLKMEEFVFNLKNLTNASVIVSNLEVPLDSAFSILENKQGCGLVESVEMINSSLRQKFKTDSRVWVFDYNAFASRHGKEGIIDPSFYYIADMKINPNYLFELASEYIVYIRALSSGSKKCLVLDLDNTLWGGVVGEDGLGGIALGDTPEGRPFLEFQKFIYSLFQRGVILAINSNNNLEDVMEVFEKHPDMILKREYFASIQVNWDDKVSKLKKISAEINIDLGSLVFIDDDPVNRALVRQFLPQVFVVDLPEDKALYVKTITKTARLFAVPQITGEDKDRGKMYAVKRQTESMRDRFASAEDYLRELKISISFVQPDIFSFPRIAQLTQKTNQFNLTTKRYLEKEIVDMHNSGVYKIYALRSEDVFGSSGLVAVAIVECTDSSSWKIDSFLMSCRVIGRKIEDALLVRIISDAQTELAINLQGEFKPTMKNSLVKDFYKNKGFSLVKEGVDCELWNLTVDSFKVFYPEFISIK